MSFGQELRSWVRRYREKEAEEGSSKTVMFVNASTVKQALEVKEWEGVDVVVAQGEHCTSATKRSGKGPS
jgi:Fe-S oxidoreductase